MILNYTKMVIMRSALSKRDCGEACAAMFENIGVGNIGVGVGVSGVAKHEGVEIPMIFRVEADGTGVTMDGSFAEEIDKLGVLKWPE